MSLTRRNILTGAAVAALASQLPLRVALAQGGDKVVRIAMPMDFTKVYTFVTAEYNQGQRDYITMMNQRGGIGGYTIAVDISDHANDQPRAIEAYERAKSQGAVLVDPLSTPVARALTRGRWRTRSTWSRRSRAARTRRTGRCSPMCSRCRRTTGPRPGC